MKWATKTKKKKTDNKTTNHTESVGCFSGNAVHEFSSFGLSAIQRRIFELFTTRTILNKLVPKVAGILRHTMRNKQNTHTANTEKKTPQFLIAISIAQKRYRIKLVRNLTKINESIYNNLPISVICPFRGDFVYILSFFLTYDKRFSICVFPFVSREKRRKDEWTNERMNKKKKEKQQNAKETSQKQQCILFICKWLPLLLSFSLVVCVCQMLKSDWEKKKKLQRFRWFAVCVYCNQTQFMTTLIKVNFMDLTLKSKQIDWIECNGASVFVCKAGILIVENRPHICTATHEIVMHTMHTQLQSREEKKNNLYHTEYILFVFLLKTSCAEFVEKARFGLSIYLKFRLAQSMNLIYRFSIAWILMQHHLNSNMILTITCPKTHDSVFVSFSFDYYELLLFSSECFVKQLVSPIGMPSMK